MPPACRLGAEGVGRRESAFAVLITACDRESGAGQGPQHGPTVILLSLGDLSHRITFLLTSARQCTHTHTHTHTHTCLLLLFAKGAFRKLSLEAMADFSSQFK